LLTFSKQSQEKKKPSRLSVFVAKLIKTTQNRQNPSKIAIALKKLCLVKNDKPASYKKD